MDIQLCNMYVRMHACVYVYVYVYIYIYIYMDMYMNTQNSEEGKCLQAMYRKMCAHVILRACANGTWPARIRRACDAKKACFVSPAHA